MLANHTRVNARVGAEVPGDLVWIDPVTVQLNLVVQPANELDGTVRKHSRAVSGAIEPGRRLTAEGVWNKLESSERGIATISASNGSASNKIGRASCRERV